MNPLEPSQLREEPFSRLTLVGRGHRRRPSSRFLNLSLWIACTKASVTLLLLRQSHPNASGARHVTISPNDCENFGRESRHLDMDANLLADDAAIR